MFLLSSRAALRRLQIAPKLVRQFGHGSPEELAAAAEKWRKIFLFVCVPSIAICSVHTYLAESEHFSHPRPEFKKYDHMYIRTKPFPWGDGNHSLFHNPVYNALPEGYEVPDPNEHKRHEHH